MNVVMLSALRTGRLYAPRNIPGTHFFWRLSQPQGHSVTGRIMSIKNSNDTIGNRTRDPPACSAVPQSTAPPRVPPGFGGSLKIHCIFRNSRPVIPILSQFNPLITFTIHYSKAFLYVIPYIHFESCLCP